MSLSRDPLDEAWVNTVAAVDYHRKTKHIKAGMAVGLINDTGIVHSRGWGSTDALAASKKQEEVTPGHVFRIGSISKLFTDIAVMRLVEAGKLDLDAPVTQYALLPFFFVRVVFMIGVE
jgi:CubicO group peptidase (beta-lactamase class C family)